MLSRCSHHTTIGARQYAQLTGKQCTNKQCCMRCRCSRVQTDACMVSVTNGDTGLLDGSLLGERGCSTGSIHHKGAARHGTRSRNRQQRSNAPRQAHSWEGACACTGRNSLTRGYGCRAVWQLRLNQHKMVLHRQPLPSAAGHEHRCMHRGQQYCTVPTVLSKASTSSTGTPRRIVAANTPARDNSGRHTGPLVQCWPH